MLKGIVYLDHLAMYGLQKPSMKPKNLLIMWLISAIEYIPPSQSGHLNGTLIWIKLNVILQARVDLQ